MEYFEIIIYEKRNKNGVIEINFRIKMQILLCFTISLMIFAYSFGIHYNLSSYSAVSLCTTSNYSSENSESDNTIKVNCWDLGEITFTNHNNILGRTDHTRNVVFIFFT
jgi:hypothetical protein